VLSLFDAFPDIETKEACVPREIRRKEIRALVRGIIPKYLHK